MADKATLDRIWNTNSKLRQLFNNDREAFDAYLDRHPQNAHTMMAAFGGKPLNTSNVNPDLKQEWNADSNLRAEFMDDFELFAAYRSNDPGVKIKTAPSIAGKIQVKI